MQNAITTTDRTAASLAPEHVAAIVEAAEAAHSPATRRNYRAAIARFASWCDTEGLDSLPAAPETVAAYLVTRAGSVGPASVRMDRASIGAAHREAGAADPTAAEGVRRVLAGLVRIAARNGHAPRQVSGLTAEALAAIRATARQPRTGPSGRTESTEAAARRGAVDIALASVMRDALLRRSEAAALRWDDVAFRADGSGRVTIRRSKTDQEGAGAVQYIGPAAAKALKAIRPATPDPDARVFGLRAPHSLANRLRAMAKAAGLEGAFPGHSGRVGMARDLVAAGASVSAVQVAGRWVSSRMPAHYARAELAGRGAVTSYYGR